MNKRVSILIPCYNHSQFVRKTLDSVLDDSYEDKEIVIIDDGSKDDSVAVIQKWIDENGDKINIQFRHRENKGVNATLNELKSIATGQYFTIMASDDFLLPNSIQKRMDVLLQHPDKMVVFGDAHVVDENDNIIQNSSIEDYHKGNKASLATDEGILSAALFRPVFSGTLEIMNKDVYSIIGEYPENISMEDWFYWQRVAINHLVVFVDEFVSCYRRHSGNATAYTKYPLWVERDVLLTCKMNLPLIKEKDFKSQFKKTVLKKTIVYQLHKIQNIFGK